MTEPKRLRVSTELARALRDTVKLRGFDVMEELVGQRYWSVVSIALGGRPLSDEECSLVDVLTTLVAIGDPRIWPLKITRLVGSYGRPSCGVAAGYTVIDGAIFGPYPAQAMARFYVDVFDAGTDETSRRLALVDRLDDKMERGERVPGFGVAGRAVDERNVALSKWRDESGLIGGEYWALYEHACAHMGDAYDLEPNFIGPIAIIGLDLGLTPAQVGGFASIQFHWAFLANAYEATRESPEILRRLPDEFVRYKGPPPRKSPRALAAERASDDENR